MNSKRIFYVERLAADDYKSAIAARPDITLTRLENATPAALADPVLAHAHIYQIGSSRGEIAPHLQVTRELLARTPSLLAVSTNGVGFDTVDPAACTEAGVLCVNQAGGNRHSVAEHVLGMMLVLSKKIVPADKAMRREAKLERQLYMGDEIRGRTLGLIGLGNVGTRVAELTRGLFEMRLLACDPYLTKEQIAMHGAEKVELDELLRTSDFVSLSCPRNAETLGMIGATQYALMQPHAIFISTARGGIHDEAALADALRGKRIAGAGVDVWDPEPPSPDHPLLKLDNVLASPHTAGVTRQARENVARMAAAQVIEILDGRKPPRLVNPEVWPRYAARFAQIMGFPVKEYAELGRRP